MLNAMMQYCRKENLIESGDYVLAGVSGGADSVCLLLLLKEFQEKLSFTLQVVHVEHGIRGEESIKDARFVEDLCHRLTIPVQCYHVDARKAAKEQRLGLEEAARILRYECYEKAAEELTFVPREKVKIALAHHADDNAETILFQMVRGSGIDGLCGMHPKRELKDGIQLIRPMLCMTRREIERYLKEQDHAYCIDSTNTDETYSRNKIRASVLPALTTINAQAVSHINQSAIYLRELSDYLNEQVLLAAKQVLKEEDGGVYILAEPFESLPLVLKKELLHFALSKAAGMAKDIGSEHIRLLLDLFSLQVGREICLPYQVIAKRVYEGVYLTKEDGEETIPFEEEVPKEALFSKEGYKLVFPAGTIHFSIVSREMVRNENLKKKYTKYLDYGKMKGSLWVRTRQSGDYLVIDDDSHTKSLKEYFIQEKFPAKLRNQIPLLAIDHKILWVIGGRISADVKISEQTDKVIKIQIEGENYYED